MSSILDQAEQRIGSTTATSQKARQDEINAMRQEIGEANYRQAPAELAKLETYINTEMRPWLAQLHAIERKTTPLPQSVQGYVKEIGDMIHIVPNTIRDGISKWDNLQPPIWEMDKKSIDLNARTQLIHQIRSALRNWDGVRGRLSDLKQFTEQYIRESAWPAGQPGAAA